METWFQAAECKELPCSLVFYSIRHHRIVSVVGNGSNFLYLLDTKEKLQLATIKFASRVVHVSRLIFAESADQARSHASDDVYAVCCLGDGRIVATNLDESLQEVKGSQDGGHPGDDIFASLLPTGATHRKKEALQGEKISVPIGACANPQTWSLCCALVCNDKLVLCKRSKKNGDTVLNIQTAVSKINMATAIIPTFHGAPTSECVLSSSKPTTPLSSQILRYRPRLEIVHKEATVPPSRLKRRDGRATINSQLFLQMFGPGVHLSESPVLLVGCQNGHILFCGLNTVGTDVKLAPSPLCSLEQPVVAMCAPLFPQSEVGRAVNELLSEEEEAGHEVGEKPSNTLLFVGQRGKITVCFVGAQEAVKFTEFHVPSPILSSLLVPDQCLIYSTPYRMHRICFRQDCVEKLDDAGPSSSLTSPILIPELSFKFPERLSPVIPNAILLEATGNSSETVGNEGRSEDVSSKGSEIQVTVMSFNGNVGSLQVSEGVGTLGFEDTNSASQELKKHLKSIEVTSEQISVTNKKIVSLNASLAELNTVLTLLCDMQATSPSCSDLQASPFSCNFSATFEDIGVSKWKPVIDIDLTYCRQTSGKPLGAGWSLLIQACSESLSKSASNIVTSKVVPLVGLVPSCSVKTRISVDVEPGGPLICSLCCILHYDASHLCAGLLQESTATSDSKSVSVLLCSKTFDALDFAQPLTQVSKQLHFPLAPIFKSLQSDERQTQHGLQIQHTLELPLFTRDTIGSDSYSAPGGLSSVSGLILRSLLPHGSIAFDTRKQSVSLTMYDGSSLTVGVISSPASHSSASSSDDSSSSKVMIRSSSKVMLAEVASCVRRRLRDNPAVKQASAVLESLTHDEKCVRRAELNRISREVNTIRGDIVSFDKEQYRDNKMRQAKFQELESRTFQLYCQLQTLL